MGASTSRQWYHGGVAGRRLLGLLTLLAGLAPGDALADVVHLNNGNAFEGVIANLTETQVRIQMPYGEMSLPRSLVARVDKSDSSLGGYLARRDALKKRPDAGAAHWLALAEWAEANDFPYGAREAALVAADLDPRLEGLAPILRRLGYALHEDLGRWVPFEDFMRRQGYVKSGGEWITAEENEARRREAEVRRDYERWKEAEVAAAAAEAAAEIYRQALEAQMAYDAYPPPLYPAGYGWYAPIAIFPGFVVPRPHPRPGRAAPPAALPAPIVPAHHHGVIAAPEALLHRQPGSLLPLGANHPELVLSSGTSR